MKIERISIMNFLRIADFDADLSGSRIHLFCGPNESGKSTVRDAFRFALVGDTDRVELKKNYKQMVHTGGKKGSVSVQFDGRTVMRDVASGQSDMAKIDDMAEQTALLAIGAQSFVDLKVDERRKFLFALTQVKADVEEIAARMAKREVTKALIDRLRSMYRVSIESAHKSCTEELTRLRAQWAQVTGETYGSVKAQTWAPTRPPASAEDLDLESLEAQFQQLNASIGEHRTAIGRIQADLLQRVMFTKSLERLRGYVQNLPTLRLDYANFKREADGGTYDGELRIGLAETISTKEELIQKAENARRILTCPGCAQALKMGTDDLEFADSDEQNFQATDEDIAALKEEVRQAKLLLANARKQMEDLGKKIGAAEKSTTLEQDLVSKLKVMPTNDDLISMESKVEGEEDDLRYLNEQMGRARSQAYELEAAAKQAVDAAEIHRKMVEWQVAADALAPSGIPGELLNEVLGTINKRMEASAHLADWLAPKITEDMDVVRADGLTYGLLSKSAKWRQSAIIADAIADMSGFKVLILDEMDMLDLKGRGQFLKWLVSLGADSYDTVLVMATLKERPRVHADIAVHWLEEGTEVFEKKGAA